jgi:hypothetical protein
VQARSIPGVDRKLIGRSYKDGPYSERFTQFQQI